MITQSFLYNAIFFTYVLVLTRFYGVDGADAPLYLIGDGSDPSRLFVGYLVGGAIMVVGGVVVEIVLGVRAERVPLESVARPLSTVPSATVPRAPGAATTFSPGNSAQHGHVHCGGTRWTG